MTHAAWLPRRGPDAVLLCALPALARGSVYVPLLTYRTGAFAGSGIPIADGMHDYLEMLNERDGGIGGVPITIEECETGYDAQKGVECYESTKGKGALVYNPYSTGITLQLIPKASVDHIPVLSMAYGLSAAADGRLFPWIFNPPDTYWDGASAMIELHREQEGGLDKLAGKKIGFIYLDAGYGREPIPLLEEMARRHGFELPKYPGPGQPDAEPVLAVAERPPRPAGLHGDVGLGRDEPDRRQGGGQDPLPDGQAYRRLVVRRRGRCARPAGDGAKGYKTLEFQCRRHRLPGPAGHPGPSRRQGLEQGRSPDRVGENLYNRGVMNSVLIAEAIATAQRLDRQDGGRRRRHVGRVSRTWTSPKPG